MVHHFGIRDEVRDATQDIWFFELGVTDRKLERSLRIVGIVLPLTKADIVPVPKTITVSPKPRYKALIALCLCAGILGTITIGLMAQPQNAIGENTAFRRF